MSLAAELRKRAAQYAHNMQIERIGNHNEITQIERSPREPWHEDRLAFLRANAQNCADTQARLAAYKPESQKDPDCPCCWVAGGRRSPVKPIPNPESGDVDIFRCRECDERYKIDVNIVR